MSSGILFASDGIFSGRHDVFSQVGCSTLLREAGHASELDLDYPDPHYLLAHLYQKLGDRAQSEREFALFEAISKRTPHVKQ